MLIISHLKTDFEANQIFWKTLLAHYSRSTNYFNAQLPVICFPWVGMLPMLLLTAETAISYRVAGCRLVNVYVASSGDAVTSIAAPTAKIVKYFNLVNCN